MTYLIIFLVVIALLVVYRLFLRPRMLRSAGTAGAQLGRAAVSGPTAKHRAMLARTLTLHGPAEATRPVVEQVIAGNDRLSEAGADTYAFDGDYPKMTVEVGPQQTHLAISEFVYMMSFPQGGKAWRAFADEVAQAASARGITVQEGAQEFVQVDSAGNHDELWFSIPRSMQGGQQPPAAG